MSPFGPEGFCGHCRMIVALTDDGKILTRHFRLSGTQMCAGSYAPPLPVPTGEIEKAAFTDEPRRAECPACHGMVPLHPEGKVFARHVPAPNTFEWCRMSFQPVEEPAASSSPSGMLPPRTISRAEFDPVEGQGTGEMRGLAANIDDGVGLIEDLA